MSIVEARLDAVLQRFTHSIQAARPISAATVAAYAMDVTALRKWADVFDKSLVSLDTSELREYLAARVAAGARPATVARQLTSYRHFYSYLTGVGAVARDPTAGLRIAARARQRPRALSTAVREAVIQPPDGRLPGGLTDYRLHRDHAMVSLLCTTSMPVSAVRELKWQQIDWTGSVIWRSASQTGGRSYQLGAAPRAALAALRTRHKLERSGDIEYCFPTAHGSPLTRQGFCQRVRKYGADLGLHVVLTPTALRRNDR